MLPPPRGFHCLMPPPVTSLPLRYIRCPISLRITNPKTLSHLKKSQSFQSPRIHSSSSKSHFWQTIPETSGTPGMERNDRGEKTARPWRRAVKVTGKRRKSVGMHRAASDVEHFSGSLYWRDRSIRPSTSTRNDAPALSRYGTRFSGDPGKTII